MQSFALKVGEGASDELRKVSIYLVLQVFYLSVGGCKQRIVIEEEMEYFFDAHKSIKRDR